MFRECLLDLLKQGVMQRPWIDEYVTLYWNAFVPLSEIRRGGIFHEIRVFIRGPEEAQFIGVCLALEWPWEGLEG